MVEKLLERAAFFYLVQHEKAKILLSLGHSILGLFIRTTDTLCVNS